MTVRRRLFVAIALAGLVPASAAAGEADVVGVRFERNGASFTFHVTVRHADAGWDHYADRWEVVGPDGGVLATRVLAHPHVDEQPFTRSQSGVAIPEDVTTVMVRAHDSIDGYGGKEVVVELTEAGDGS